ncbi:unnamed protein product, partial [Rotaria sp. Silwood2]
IHNQLVNNFSNNELKFQEILNQHNLYLLILISNKQGESEDIQCNLNVLEYE